MGTHNMSASAQRHGSSESHTYQLPQDAPTFETPKTPQRKMRIPVSPSCPRKSLGIFWDRNRSSWIPTTPEDVFQSAPSSGVLPMNGLGDQRSHDPPAVASTSDSLAANRSQSLIASPGLGATARDTFLGDESPGFGGRETLDEHRLEATATMARLQCSKLFENAKTLNEQIHLLTALWTSIREDNEYVTTVSGPIGAKDIPAQIEMTRPNSESAAVLQSFDKAQWSNSKRKSLVLRDDSPPKTPDSHGLKRKRSNLTSPNTEAFTSQLHRLSLAVPPPFKLDSVQDQSPPSPTESRRTRPCVRRITSENDLQPAKIGEPKVADGSLNMSIIDDDRAVSSVGLQYTPKHIQGNKHGANDDLYGPFARSDHDAMILTRDVSLPAGDSYANLSHSSFRAEQTSAQDSKGSLYYSDQRIARKLAPYTLRPPKLCAPEIIICEAIIKPLTKHEMGIAWTKTSSGKWIQQTSHTGWIYIYQLPNELNTVKIGLTQVSIEGRLDSWTEQCGHKTQIAYPSTQSECEPVPNVYRLEALVHAELAASRLEEVGCPCGKKHIEWFEEAVAHARKVVVKWSEWMRTNPYKEVHPKHWHLLPQYIPNLTELTRPSSRDLEQEGSATNPVLI